MNIAASVRKAAAAAWRPARNWRAAWRTSARGDRAPRSALAAKYAELENLVRAPGRCVFVPLGVNRQKPGTERLREARCVVTRDRQTAAFFRAIERESRDDGVSAGFQTAHEARDIGGAVFFVGEKVERRPVVPDVLSPRRLPDRGICHQPLNPVGTRAEASPGGLQCRVRQIEHRDILKPQLDEMVDQPRRAATNVDDGRLA